MAAACVLLVSSGQNLVWEGGVAGASGRRGLGEIICIMQSQSVHLQVGSLERKTAPLLMPCVFTEEVGHSTMEPAAAVGTLPLHNTLSVMCSDYSEPQPLLHPPPKAVILFCKCTWT